MKNLLARSLVLFSLISVAVCSQAAVQLGQPATVAAELEHLLQSSHDNDQFNGNFLVAHKNIVLFKTSLGKRNLLQSEANNQLDDHSLFRLASLSKPFTSTVILRLQELGKLDINDPVQNHLPQFPYPAIRISQLLSHTSGLPDHINLFFDSSHDRNTPVSNENVLSLLVEQNPDLQFTPGSQYKYSNTGYVLLPLIAQEVMDEPYSLILRNLVLEPAGMTSTRIINAHTTDLPENYTHRHWYNVAENELVSVNKGESKAGNFLGNTMGDGCLNSSTIDLLKFHRALQSGHLLSAESLALAQSQYTLVDGSKIKYGLGWEIIENPRVGKIISHGGKFDGARSKFAYLPDHDLVVISLSNTDNFYADQVFRSATRIVLDKTCSPFPYKFQNGWKRESSQNPCHKYMKNLKP